MTWKSWAACLSSVAVTAALAGCGLIRAPGSTWGTPSGAGVATIPPPVAAPPTAAAHPVVSVSALKNPRGKFFGVEASGAPDNIGPITSIAAGLGVNPNLIGQYVTWGRPFDPLAATNALNSGALYYMVWEPFGPGVQSIVDGASDAYITRFAQAARASINVESSGRDAHHVAEAAFKAVGRALRAAVRPEGAGLPSTKGLL